MKFAMTIKPAVFLLIIILFFLPFAQIRCDSTIVTEMKGIDFVTGKEIEDGKKDSDGPSKVEPNKFAIMAFLSAIVGFFISFFSKKIMIALGEIVSLIGMVMLLLFKNDLETQIIQTKESFGLITINYLFAFWASFALFVLYVVFSLSVLLSQKSR